jgi:hypothetical protein
MRSYVGSCAGGTGKSSWNLRIGKPVSQRAFRQEAGNWGRRADFGVSTDKEFALGGVHTETGERVDFDLLLKHI